MKYMLLLALVLSVPSCAKAPPNLTPQAVTAFYGTRVVKTLDLIRDTADNANLQVPPVVSNTTLRQIVTWHQAAVKTVHEAPAGWRATVLAGLDQLLTVLPASDRQLFTPYVALAKTVLQETAPALASPVALRLSGVTP